MWTKLGCLTKPLLNGKETYMYEQIYCLIRAPSFYACKVGFWFDHEQFLEFVRVSFSSTSRFSKDSWPPTLCNRSYSSVSNVFCRCPSYIFLLQQYFTNIPTLSNHRWLRLCVQMTRNYSMFFRSDGWMMTPPLTTEFMGVSRLLVSLSRFLYALGPISACWSMWLELSAVTG